MSRFAAHLGRNWFVYAIPLALAASWASPELMCDGGTFASQIWWRWLIVAIFLASGLGLPLRELSAAAGRWRLHLAIQACSLIAIPLVAWASLPVLARLLGPDLATGCLLLACQPTTIAGCIALTRAAGGDVAAALFNAAAGNLLGVAATPAMALLLTGISLHVSFASVLLKLGELVLLPLLVGQLLRRGIGEERANRLTPWTARLSMLCLLGICWHAFSDGFHRGLPQLPSGALAWLVLAVLGGHIVAMAVAWWLGGRAWMRLDPRGRVALTIVATQKTIALGVPMLSVMFAGDPRLALFTLPLLLWHPIQMLVASVLAPRFAAWVSRG